MKPANYEMNNETQVILIPESQSSFTINKNVKNHEEEINLNAVNGIENMRKELIKKKVIKG